MKKLLLFVLLFVFTVSVFGQVRPVPTTRTEWYWAQFKMTIAAGASPDTTAEFTNSFFNAVIWTPNDSTYIKIGTYKNAWTSVDSLVYLIPNVPFYVPGFWGVKQLYAEMGAAGANDAGAIYIAGDKYVTE